jgi:MoxR-like ATPase
MADTTKAPSTVVRDAVRRALRDHPDLASIPEAISQGKPVNSWAKDQLQAGLDYLGLNLQTIADAALAGETVEVPYKVTPQQLQLGDDDDQGEAPAVIDDDIETEVQSVRSLVITGGFSALDDKIRALIIAGRKPPVTVEVMVPVPSGPAGAVPVHVARRTGKTETWRRLFDVRSALGANTAEIWDGTHPDTPKVNERYLWPQPQTAIILSQLHRGRNAFGFGPMGTGKTAWAEQLAARTGRPFALISCDAGTDGATLVGMTVPAAGGGVTWQDGQLARAVRTPGCVVCIDEPSVARSGALFVMQNMLQYRQLFIAETGERVPVASGVIFIATDNTNGTGGGARRGYVDTNRLNAAFTDRFGPRVEFTYMKPDQEIGVIVGYTKCTPELAGLLVAAAQVTRAAADDQTLSHGIGLRRLLTWAELLTDGIGVEEAFQAAVLNCAPEQDRETLREQCLLAYDKDAVMAALNPSLPLPAPDATLTNPTPAGRSAAGEFTTV